MPGDRRASEEEPDRRLNPEVRPRRDGPRENRERFLAENRKRFELKEDDRRRAAERLEPEKDLPNRGEAEKRDLPRERLPEGKDRE